MTAEMSIQQVARVAGTTSRALRHYDRIGLLHPSSVGANGYRMYDTDALVRLQRILLLRDMGVGLAQIGEILERHADEAGSLRTHLGWLEQERRRIERQISAVASTVDAIENGRDPMTENMFDGFDHTQHQEEVERRWGAETYASSDRWWRSLSDEERAAFQEETRALAADWAAAAEEGEDPRSARAQELAERHVAWLSASPTPARDPEQLHGYVRGLGDMYVADPRFGANYGGEAGASFVRDALRAWVEARER